MCRPTGKRTPARSAAMTKLIKPAASVAISLSSRKLSCMSSTSAPNQGQVVDAENKPHVQPSNKVDPLTQGPLSRSSSIYPSSHVHSLVTEPKVDRNMANNKDRDNVDKETCHWNAAEEAILVHALIKEQAEGRQVENGFKPQAWRNVLEAEQFKGSRPKTIEQSKSRWQRLKKEYRIVKNLRHIQDFAWDEERALIIGNHALWEAYLERHPEAKPFRKKAFPLYDAIASLMEHSSVYRVQESATDDLLMRQEVVQSREKAPASTDRSCTPGDEYEDSEDNNEELYHWESCPDTTRRRSGQDTGDCQEGPAVGHIVYDFQRQEMNMAPRLRTTRPTTFSPTATRPSAIRSKRSTPSDHIHEPYFSSTYANEYLHSTAMEGPKPKRRRPDNSDVFSHNRVTTQSPPHPVPILRQQRQPTPPFPDSSSVHHLARSLDNLVTCLSETSVPVPSLYRANTWYERKSRAWNKVLDEEILLEEELALARRVFRGNAELADEYLSFPGSCKGARTLWLKREIKELAERDGQN